MNRQNNSKREIALSTMGLFSLAIAAQAQSEPPNVLFILADDLGWNDIACMGSTFYETPHLDKLAQQGVRFTNAYAACQVSSPSRATILTGKYPARHGITNWIGEPSGEAWRTLGRHSKMLPADYTRALPSEDVTLPEYLKQYGYTTFLAGKWHLGGEGSYPENHGFDINKGGWELGSPKGGYFSPWINPSLPNEVDGENLSMRLAQETVYFMENCTKDKPFFAYLSFYAVHGPIQTTQEKWSYFRNKAVQQGVAEQGFAIDRTLPVRMLQDNPVYAGLVQQMDDAIGYVLTALEEMGLAENTLIIFTSDNGGLASGDSSSTSLYPLRGGKGRQWEGGIRVPLLVKAPHLATAGTTCDVPVIGTDYYPTILSYAALPLNDTQHVDGVDILPLLNGEEIADRALYWHYPHYGNQGGEPSSIIRKGDWKLIYYHEDARSELYNLAIDITECEQLNHIYPDKVTELDRELQAWLLDTNAQMPIADTEYDPVKEHAVKKKWKTTTLEQVEKLRLKMLAEDWQPNKNWWGSQVTID